ncbi:MAG: hypothetical protein QXM00_11795 [Candidatus Bathyarchaeia archaeon]
MPIIIEFNAESLNALDNLKWIVNKITEWIDEKTRPEEHSGQE